MCGICVAHGLEKPSADRVRLIACSKKIRHRGPDWSGCYVGQQSVLVHERLAIVGVGALFCFLFDVVCLSRPLTDTGAQPLVSDSGKIILAVNGEIYNHTKLRESLKSPYAFKTHSDCEVIIPLVRMPSESCCNVCT